ncbi:YrdB family protein [Kitasatospora sp. NPDC085464]|uniref:YrdB family protein n=1 Tax=Kitasatospora sp. NPDC085464 TaxID=3364063 RepID=UPI0037C793C3
MTIDGPGPAERRLRRSLATAGTELGFGVQLASLAALCYWGFRTGDGLGLRLLLGLGVPAAARAVWDVFLAEHRAKVELPLAARLVLKLVLLGSAAVALHATGLTTLAAVFAALVVFSLALDFGNG